MNTELIQWIIASLFWLSVLVTLCGLVFIISPGSLLRYSNKLNKWVSTAGFFESLDRPRHIEKIVYRNHRLFGLIFMIAAVYCLYIFFFVMDVQRVIKLLPVIGNASFSIWLYEVMYYLLLSANGLALIVSLIILVRPSVLKGLEARANRWITTDKYTKPLDQEHSIPEHILPGNVRLFGFLVMLGGLYIMFNTGVLWIRGM